MRKQAWISLTWLFSAATPHRHPHPPPQEQQHHNPLTFRDPVEADYLGSSARKSHLLPRHEVFPSEFDLEGDVLSEKNLGVLERTQGSSAVGHWRVMRGVLPKEVWEGW